MGISKINTQRFLFVVFFSQTIADKLLVLHATTSGILVNYL